MQYDDSLSESYRRFLAGDESAAREVMDGLFLGLVRFIAGYVRDMPSAEDIAMDVMAELFAKRRGYEPRSKLKTYAYMRGKCLALDLLRHRKALAFDGLDACFFQTGHHLLVYHLHSVREWILRSFFEAGQSAFEIIDDR